MDGGDRRPSFAFQDEDKVVLFATVPRELKFLVILYQRASRMQSFSEAMRRLLETHPELTKVADRLYTHSE